MKFLDLFAGIGGFRLGMESAGHECVGFCEIDKFARNSYKAIHDTEGEVEMQTLQQYQMSLFEESEVSMLSVADFRAKLSALQESGKVSKILEELSSLKLQGSHLFSDHAIYSLRTSKDSSITKEGLRSRRSSEPWMNSGMTVSGTVLTQRLTFRKIGSEYSLSDILEENVPEKYFLSQEMTNRLLSYKDNKVQSIQSRQDMETHQESDRTLLKVNSRNK